MKKDAIHELLINLSQNKITVDQAFEHLKDLPFQDLGFAKLDSSPRDKKKYPGSNSLCRQNNSTNSNYL